jgi:leucyl aminopeptidase
LNTIFDLPQRLTIQLATEQNPAIPSIQLLTVSDETTINTPTKSVGDILYTDNRVIISLGDSPNKISAETFRKAGGSLAKWLIQHNVANINLELEEIPTFQLPDAISAFYEGLLLGAFQFTRYKKSETSFTPVQVWVHTPSEKRLSAQAQIERSSRLCAAVNLARDWSHEPANIINPVTLAERAQLLAERYGLRCSILTDQELEAIGAGAIVAVGKGSQTPSRLIVIEYPGKNPPPNAQPIILVGKALTFDTGGYSIKTTEGIVGMKYDKCGGITVLATILAAAELGLSQPIIGIIGAAENMISAQAYRPDDIIRSLSGKTIEVISTDAEGRLVLADALTYAQKNFHPRAIIDLATLTGGVLVALGRVRAGLMSNDDTLAQALYTAGQVTFERLWRLPLDEEFAQLIKSDDADIKNSGGREGHCILGGTFLKQFIEDTTPWAHLDIAGMADSPKEGPYCPKGATGFGVRLLIQYLETL